MQRCSAGDRLRGVHSRKTRLRAITWRTLSCSCYSAAQSVIGFAAFIPGNPLEILGQPSMRTRLRQRRSAHHSRLPSKSPLDASKKLPIGNQPEKTSRESTKLHESNLGMIRVLRTHSRRSVLKLLNYQITRLPNLSRLPSLNSRVTQSWFQLLCPRSGCRRVLRTKAGGLAAVNPACAEAAAVHGRTACRAASARGGIAQTQSGVLAYGGRETQDPRVAPFISTQEHAPLHGWVALQRPLQTPITPGCLCNCRAETVPAQRTVITRAAKSVALIFLPMIRSPFKRKAER
jgi:hypothetical protein